MIKALFIFIILFGCNCVQAQENEVNSTTFVHHQFDNDENFSRPNQAKKQNFLTDNAADQESKKLCKPLIFAAEPERKRNALPFLKVENEDDAKETDLKEIKLSEQVADNNFGQYNFIKKKFDKTENESAEKFHWKPALEQSGLFLGIQHGFRLFQAKTQRELRGPFFRDWANSVKNLRGWRDGDNTFINYVGHPMQGAATGRIFINNSEKSRKLEFSMSKDYWTSRMKAMAWSAVWSTQFELGPISEATIGNVGLHPNHGYTGMGFVDLVMTPTAGTGVLIGEDIIDKYIMRKWLERKLTSRTRIKVYRTFFTPLNSFINVLGGKKPWKRYNRP